KSRAHMPERTLEILAASELLLRVAHVGRVRALRVRVAIGMARAGVSCRDALLAVPRHRHSALRDASTQVARRRVSPLPADHQRFRAVASEAESNSSFKRSGQQRTWF